MDNKKQINWNWKYCNHKDLKYFCENFHYSKTAPPSSYKFLFYENDKAVGVISFGSGANRNIGKPFNLEQNEVIELTRCAFTEHHNYLSMYISKSIKEIKKNKDIKMVISYSDLRYSHFGSLYKSFGFKYDGERKMSGIEIYKNERWTHQRNFWNEWKNSNSGMTFKDWCGSKYEIRPQSNKIRWVFKLKNN